jgi:hypothetical protein
MSRRVLATSASKLSSKTELRPHRANGRISFKRKELKTLLVTLNKRGKTRGSYASINGVSNPSASHLIHYEVDLENRHSINIGNREGENTISTVTVVYHGAVNSAMLP